MLEISDTTRKLYEAYFRCFQEHAIDEYAELSYGTDKIENGTSSSLESIIAYTRYIDDSTAKILNAGAGASSWMFRQLFRDVTCTDPNEFYLEFIRKLCTSRQGPFQRDMFFTHKFDHVYFDYGDIERLPYLGSAIDLAKKSVYVDDTDKRECCKFYREFVIDLCKSLKLEYRDLEEATDKEGRGGLIIIK